MDPIKTIEGSVPGYKAHIYYDPDAIPPDSDIVKIAYLRRARRVLGTEAVTEERLDEINADIRAGKLVGVPVWAYVHSGATISTGKPLKGGSTARLRMNPFNCPWDSGRSGVAYMTREDALSQWGHKRLSAQQKKRAEAFIDSVVEEFALYLQGECYGFKIVAPDGTVLDQCWGFVGMEHVEAEATASLAHVCKDASVQGELDLK